MSLRRKVPGLVPSLRQSSDPEASSCTENRTTPPSSARCRGFVAAPGTYCGLMSLTRSTVSARAEAAGVTARITDVTITAAPLSMLGPLHYEETAHLESSLASHRPGEPRRTVH